MSERPYTTSVDMGDVGWVALNSAAKREKTTKTAVIRKAVILYDTLHLDEIEELVHKSALVRVRKKQKSSMTDDERAVIDCYRVVYSYDGRIHFPAVLAAMRSAEKAGVSHQDMMELIKVSPQDELVIKSGRKTLHELLSSKFISRLMNLRDTVVRQGEVSDQLRVENEVKPEALRMLKDKLPPNAYSKAWELMKEASTEEEVDEVVAGAMSYVEQVVG